MPAATFLLGDLLVAAESTVAAVEAPGIGESPVGRKSTGMMGALADEAGAFVSGSETPRYGIGAPPETAGASPPEAAGTSPPEAEAKAAGGAGASTGGAGALSGEAGASAGGTGASAGGTGASPPEAAGTSSPPEAEAKAAGEAGGTVASSGTSADEAGASAGGTVASAGASTGGTVASTCASAGASSPEAEAKAAGGAVASAGEADGTGASPTSSTLANHRSSVSADTLEISASEGEVVVTGAWATASDAPVTPPLYGGTKANGWALALAIPSVLNASAPPETSDGLKTSLAGRGPLGVSTVPASGATPDGSGDGSQPMAGDTEGAIGSGIVAVSAPPQVAVGLSDDTVSPLATATSSAPGTGAAISGKGPSGVT